MELASHDNGGQMNFAEKILAADNHCNLIVMLHFYQILTFAIVLRTTTQSTVYTVVEKSLNGLQFAKIFA